MLRPAGDTLRSLMLAQNGANINAKTRNGETPYDICEDPDIKERYGDSKQTKNTRRLKCNFSGNIFRDKLNWGRRDAGPESLFESCFEIHYKKICSF